MFFVELMITWFVVDLVILLGFAYLGYIWYGDEKHFRLLADLIAIEVNLFISFLYNL